MIEDSPVISVLRELGVPAMVKQSIEAWETLPRHVRDAVETLLRGEMEAFADSRFVYARIMRVGTLPPWRNFPMARKRRQPIRLRAAARRAHCAIVAIARSGTAPS